MHADTIDMCRYGDQAGQMSRRSLGMAVDAYDVYGSYRSMRTRALAKAFFKGGFGDDPRDPTTEPSMQSAGVATDAAGASGSSGGVDGKLPQAAVGYGGKEGETYMPPSRPARGIDGAGAGAGPRATEEDEYSVELVQPLEPSGEARWGWNR